MQRSALSQLRASWRGWMRCALYGLNLKVQGDQGNDHALEILDEVVEGAEALRICSCKHASCEFA
jgi:hypothetical protein